MARLDSGKVQLKITWELFRAHSRQIQSEPFLAVEPRLFQVEARDAQHAFHHFERVLVTVFGMNAFTLPELNTEPRHAQSNFLRAQAFKKNFHSRSCRC